MKYNNIFLVESPLQLINALEAIDYFNIDSYYIFIRFTRIAKNDVQMSKLIETFSINEQFFHIFTISGDKKTLFDIVKIFLYCIFFMIINNRKRKLYIGNYYSPFMNKILQNFIKRNIILLDDGAKSINIQDSFSISNNLNLFSIYDFEPFRNQVIYKNNYTVSARKLENCVKNENLILFIGSKLNEIEIISKEYYISLIERISLLYSDKNILYIPHRGENNEKLNIISRIENISIKELDFPVEIYGFYEKEIPNTVISFYSTALLTMNKLYPNTKCISYKFDYSSSSYKKEINRVYEYYKKYIDVVENV